MPFNIQMLHLIQVTAIVDGHYGKGLACVTNQDQ